MPRSVHVGVIGAGAIARDHLLSLRRLAPVSAITLFDADAARAHKLAGELGVPAAASLRDLLNRCDLAWVCTPPFAHRAVVEAAARAGKAIFCEKPLAHRIEDAEAIRRAVQRAGVPFFMGQSGRYSAFFVLMKSLLDRGAVGEPTLFWSTRQGYLDPSRAPAWRLDDAKSGGAVVELGVHEIDFVNWMGGRWKSVAAVGSSAALNPGRFQDSVVAVGALASGAAARIDLSWSNPRYLWQRGIRGVEGELFFDDARLREVMLSKPGRKPKVFLTREKDWMDRASGENLSLRDQDRAVLAALVRGGPPPVTLDDGYAAVRVALAIRHAARSGAVVRV